MEAENDKKTPKKQYINLNISAIKNAKYILQKVQSKKRHLVCKIKKNPWIKSRVTRTHLFLAQNDLKTTFLGPKWHSIDEDFFWKTINIIFMHFSAPFSVQSFKKMLSKSRIMRINSLFPLKQVQLPGTPNILNGSCRLRFS